MEWRIRRQGGRLAKRLKQVTERLSQLCTDVRARPHDRVDRERLRHSIERILRTLSKRRRPYQNELLAEAVRRMMAQAALVGEQLAVGPRSFPEDSCTIDAIQDSVAGLQETLIDLAQLIGSAAPMAAKPRSDVSARHQTTDSGDS